MEVCDEMDASTHPMIGYGAYGVVLKHDTQVIKIMVESTDTGFREATVMNRLQSSPLRAHFPKLSMLRVTELSSATRKYISELLSKPIVIPDHQLCVCLYMTCYACLESQHVPWGTDATLNRLTDQMTRALEAMHELYLLHLDIGMDNIMWDTVVKVFVLIDFSLAKEMSGTNQTRSPPRGQFTCLYKIYARPPRLMCYMLPQPLTDLTKHPEPTPADDFFALGAAIYYYLAPRRVDYTRIPDKGYGPLSEKATHDFLVNQSADANWGLSVIADSETRAPHHMAGCATREFIDIMNAWVRPAVSSLDDMKWNRTVMRGPQALQCHIESSKNITEASVDRHLANMFELALRANHKWQSIKTIVHLWYRVARYVCQMLSIEDVRRFVDAVEDDSRLLHVSAAALMLLMQVSLHFTRDIAHSFVVYQQTESMTIQDIWKAAEILLNVSAHHPALDDAICTCCTVTDSTMEWTLTHIKNVAPIFDPSSRMDDRLHAYIGVANIILSHVGNELYDIRS